MKKRAPCDKYFFQITNQIVYLKLALAIYFSSRKYKLSNISNFGILLHNRFYARYFVHPTKGCLVDEKHVQNVFSPEPDNNLHQAFHF